MYRTEESPCPRCALSTACTVSQCPVAVGQSHQGQEEISLDSHNRPDHQAQLGASRPWSCRASDGDGSSHSALVLWRGRFRGTRFPQRQLPSLRTSESSTENSWDGRTGGGSSMQKKGTAWEEYEEYPHRGRCWTATSSLAMAGRRSIGYCFSISYLSAEV